MAEDPLASLDRGLARNRRLRLGAGIALFVVFLGVILWAAAVGHWVFTVLCLPAVGFYVYAIGRYWGGEDEPDPLPPGPSERA